MPPWRPPRFQPRARESSFLFIHSSHLSLPQNHYLENSYLKVCLLLLTCDRQLLSIVEDSLKASVFLTLRLTVIVNYELRLVDQIDFLSPSSCPGCDLIPP